ncbi:hypothetical protein CEUSTIGMA_g7051.t1 [Chlamydomonas eustigma]|uniref:Uncharacterized protein n=1 Tax=Chlamydomonas eustigma TaxID=1157962 RepID=A0A250XA23_9CHLO|nr:hypothetical protein CEUSTIGMA_g7051.t1 [Chlamydomonas eustigma]|eukprot:GAX79610.1 hypothetical protein CEUSTIGMA_g7051.t1 [Chlamydomonas eustigma]
MHLSLQSHGLASTRHSLLLLSLTFLHVSTTYEAAAPPPYHAPSPNPPEFPYVPYYPNPPDPPEPPPIMPPPSSQPPVTTLPSPLLSPQPNKPPPPHNPLPPPPHIPPLPPPILPPKPPPPNLALPRHPPSSPEPPSAPPLPHPPPSLPYRPPHPTPPSYLPPTPPFPFPSPHPLSPALLFSPPSPHAASPTPHPNLKPPSPPAANVITVQSTSTIDHILIGVLVPYGIFLMCGLGYTSWLVHKKIRASQVSSAAIMTTNMRRTGSKRNQQVVDIEIGNGAAARSGGADMMVAGNYRESGGGRFHANPVYGSKKFRQTCTTCSEADTGALIRNNANSSMKQRGNKQSTSRAQRSSLSEEESAVEEESVRHDAYSQRMRPRNQEEERQSPSDRHSSADEDIDDEDVIESQEVVYHRSYQNVSISLKVAAVTAAQGQSPSSSNPQQRQGIIGAHYPAYPADEEEEHAAEELADDYYDHDEVEAEEGEDEEEEHAAEELADDYYDHDEAEAEEGEDEGEEEEGYAGSAHPTNQRSVTTHNLRNPQRQKMLKRSFYKADDEEEVEEADIADEHEEVEQEEDEEVEEEEDELGNSVASHRHGYHKSRQFMHDTREEIEAPAVEDSSEEGRSSASAQNRKNFEVRSVRSSRTPIRLAPKLHSHHSTEEDEDEEVNYEEDDHLQTHEQGEEDRGRYSRDYMKGHRKGHEQEEEVEEEEEEEEEEDALRYRYRYKQHPHHNEVNSILHGGLTSKSTSGFHRHHSSSSSEHGDAEEEDDEVKRVVERAQFTQRGRQTDNKESGHQRPPSQQEDLSAEDSDLSSAPGSDTHEPADDMRQNTSYAATTAAPGVHRRISSSTDPSTDSGRPGIRHTSSGNTSSRMEGGVASSSNVPGRRREYNARSLAQSAAYNGMISSSARGGAADISSYGFRRPPSTALISPKMTQPSKTYASTRHQAVTTSAADDDSYSDSSAHTTPRRPPYALRKR